MPKKLLSVVVCCLLVTTVGFFLIPAAKSDELDDINNQLKKLNDALAQSIAATKPLESQVQSMQQQIAGIKSQVAGIEADLSVKKKEIDDGYKNLAQKQELLNHTVRDFYIRSYYNSPLLTFLSAGNAAEVSQALAYQKAAANQDKTIIAGIALSINDLEEKSKELKDEQTRLISVKASLDDQSAKLDKIIAGAKDYQQSVSSQIASLTAQQQSILNARSGSFTASIGDSDLADDYNASITGFRESAPAGSFAVFSFGAYTHRKGMSQYGAYGRASKGQSYRDILQAYYGKQPTGTDTSGNINVDGVGSIDFESNYLMGIAEMPSSFPMEALKAQAVAARTYALRYKQNGQSICTDESCQVYSSSKAANPPDAWKQAVQATKGEVIQDVVTYFSSTSGGYLDTMGWDTTDGQGGSSFADRAYEKIAGSPWFYKAWWRKGYSSTGDTCGRSNPWMTSTEMADIINGAMVLYHGGSSDETARVTPVTTSCWGGNPYSTDDLRNVSGKYGGGVSSVSSVSVLQGNGVTNDVVFQTDKGEIHISGSDFKTAFNLRASGYMSIPQNGFSFFNIEHK